MPPRRRAPALLAFATLAASLTACVKPIPPVPPSAQAERTGTAAAASFGRAWDAVIDDFAARNVAIRTVDRASGFVAAEPVAVPGPLLARRPHAWADCGAVRQEGYYQPQSAVYNVVVRGDSAAATVRATVQWIALEPTYSLRVPSVPHPCTSRGVWEAAFEADVKARAERPRPPQRQSGTR